jgi:hypothetical protein
MIYRNPLRSFLLLSLLQISTIIVVQAQNSTTTDDDGTTGTSRDRNLDRFNYDTNQHTAQYFNFGPEDWGDIRCPDEDTCVRKYKSLCVLLGMTNADLWILRISNNLFAYTLFLILLLFNILGHRPDGLISGSMVSIGN